jgi:hypothetical protein
VLPRQQVRSPHDRPAVGVKRVERPGGELSAKAELAEIAAANETYAGRQRLRRIAEQRALDEGTAGHRALDEGTAGHRALDEE